MKKIVCIIQAHTTSTRLSNKIFKDLNGQPMIYHVVDRVSQAKKVDEVIVATSTEKEDDILEEFSIKNNIKFFRCSDKNVLDRYYNAAKEKNADIIIRITSDCPLVEPHIIHEVIEFYCSNNYDYVSPSSDLRLIRGLDTEIFSKDALERAKNLANTKCEQKHVTLYRYKNQQIFPKLKIFRYIMQ